MDFAVSHSPAWANATAAAIAWNLSLQDLILEPRLISIRLPLSFIKFRAKFKPAALEAGFSQ
jgi:hypothetical protein